MNGTELVLNIGGAKPYATVVLVDDQGLEHQLHDVVLSDAGETILLRAKVAPTPAT